MSAQPVPSPASAEEQMVLQAGRVGLPLAESLRKAKDLEARSQLQVGEVPPTRYHLPAGA